MLIFAAFFVVQVSAEQSFHVAEEASKEKSAFLSSIVHDIKTILGGQIHAKQRELNVDIMDVADEDVFCDKTRLNQVLLNLLSNAIKFTIPDGAATRLPIENRVKFLQKSESLFRRFHRHRGVLIVEIL